jgi:hypothetical protein
MEYGKLENGVEDTRIWSHQLENPGFSDPEKLVA